jgi:hypothetical protein
MRFSGMLEGNPERTAIVAAIRRSSQSTEERDREKGRRIPDSGARIQGDVELRLTDGRNSSGAPGDDAIANLLPPES